VKEFYLENLSKSRLLASRLSALLKTGDILAFEGNLGTGKTEFCRAIIHALGYDEDVPSPTFNLLQIYEPSIEDLKTPAVWHMDLYRLENAQDVFELGIEDGFDSAVTMIEWPERMGNYLPAEHLKITLSHGDNEGSRYISFDGDPSWEQRIKELKL
tara:strand:- start:44998 stop:45468 length:471 start_codon:yes stop_codon:yes gene_type:complete